MTKCESLHRLEILKRIDMRRHYYYAEISRVSKGLPIIADIKMAIVRKRMHKEIDKLKRLLHFGPTCNGRFLDDLPTCLDQ